MMKTITQCSLAAFSALMLVPMTPLTMAADKAQAAEFQGAPATLDRYRVVYQINNGDEAHIKSALKNIGNALSDPRLQGKLQVELVVHGGGVKTFRKDGGFEQTLRSLQEKGVVLAQCENTLKERNISKTELLPFISYVPSGNGELIILQQQGWAIIHP